MKKEDLKWLLMFGVAAGSLIVAYLGYAASTTQDDQAVPTPAASPARQAPCSAGSKKACDNGERGVRWCVKGTWGPCVPDAKHTFE